MIVREWMPANGTSSRCGIMGGGGMTLAPAGLRETRHYHRVIGPALLRPLVCGVGYELTARGGTQADGYEKDQ